MPCSCWFEPNEQSKKMIRFHCKAIVDEIKSLEEIGDSIGVSIDLTKQLLDHLYTGKYPEKEKNNG